MNKLREFKNSEFGSLGVLLINGKEYFPATDCARALGYEKPNNAITQHCRYSLKQGVPHPQNPDKTIEMNFIPEGDLYRLIIRSKLPAAERFERWVFDEVIPSIRRTGAYYGKRAPGRPRISSTGAYIPKFWKGEQVVTIRDISTQTGFPYGNIKRQINHRVKELGGDEAMRLIGDELAEFIAENPAMPPAYRAFGLWIFNERGFNRIASWPRDVGKSSGHGWTWDAFTVSAQLPAPQLPATQPSVTQVTISRIAPDRPAERPASSLNVQELRKTLVALDVTLGIYECAPTAQHEAEGAAALSAIASHFLKLTADG